MYTTPGVKMGFSKVYLSNLSNSTYLYLRFVSFFLVYIQYTMHTAWGLDFHVQGVFLTGTPSKNSKYKKVNLG